MKKIVYAFCRTSTNKQRIERQERNILAVYPNAIVVKEVYTGTVVNERKEFTKLCNLAKEEVKKGNNVTIVFDEVSRMARNSEEGYNLYMDLFDFGVNLVFLKEPHINTSTFSEALKNNIALTGSNVDIILKAIKEYLMEVAKTQIRLAFEQAEKEVEYLHQRTREGLMTAKLNGKKLGREKGKIYKTKKEEKCLEIIKKNSKAFDGFNTDIEIMKICEISRNTFYKYKSILKESNTN